MECIYWVSEGYIQRYTPETKFIFRPRQKNSQSQGRARGPKAQGHGPARGNFSDEDEK